MSNADTRVFLQTLHGPDPHHNESQFLQIDRDLFAWVGTPFDPPRYIPPHNHSCSPNCVIEWSTLTMKTWRRVRPNEELTWDYSLSMGPQETWRLPCRCGSRTCRGIVGRFVDLPLDVQQRYLSAGVVPMFVREQVAVF